VIVNNTPVASEEMLKKQQRYAYEIAYGQLFQEAHFL